MKTKTYKIALLKGDGIGPEIVESAVQVLEAVGKKRSLNFEFTPYLIGGIAIDTCGEPLPKATVEGCLNADSVLLGAVGGPKWDNLAGNIRPEKPCWVFARRWDCSQTFALLNYILPSKGNVPCARISWKTALIL